MNGKCRAGIGAARPVYSHSPDARQCAAAQSRSSSAIAARASSIAAARPSMRGDRAAARTGACSTASAARATLPGADAGGRAPQRMRERRHRLRRRRCACARAAGRPAGRTAAAPRARGCGRRRSCARDGAVDGRAAAPCPVDDLDRGLRHETSPGLYGPLLRREFDPGGTKTR